MWKAGSLACVLTLATHVASVVPVYGDVVATFDGGNSSAVVDGYNGTAGNGWTSAWRTYHTSTTATSAAATVTAGMGTGTALTPTDGNYLSVSVKTDAVVGQYGQGVVQRSWSKGSDGVDTSGMVKIEFDFRPTVVSSASRYVIFDSDSNKTGTDSSVTFQIAAIASGWKFYDGKGSNNTTTIYSNNAALVQDHTYHLTIEVTNAGKWRGSVIDLNAAAPTTYSTDWIGFRTGNTDLYRYLYFGASDSTAGTADDLGFDIDSITISAIPEPASLGLLGMIGAFMLTHKKR